MSFQFAIGVIPGFRAIFVAYGSLAKIQGLRVEKQPHLLLYL
jgi:hypothetical protein